MREEGLWEGRREDRSEEEKRRSERERKNGRV